MLLHQEFPASLACLRWPLRPMSCLAHKTATCQIDFKYLLSIWIALALSLFSQLSIFTADCLRHPIQMAGVETIWELHTLSVIYSWLVTYLWYNLRG